MIMKPSMLVFALQLCDVAQAMTQLPCRHQEQMTHAAGVHIESALHVISTTCPQAVRDQVHAEVQAELHALRADLDTSKDQLKASDTQVDATFCQGCMHMLGREVHAHLWESHV
jgi:hypothetical protein